MKRVIIFLSILMTVTVFSFQKSGISKFDTLNYGRGLTIAYFDNSGKLITAEGEKAYYERKLFKNGSKNIIVTYYYASKEPAVIFETSNESEAKTNFAVKKREGDVVSYYPNGNLQSTGAYKNNMEDGLFKLYSGYGFLLAEGTYKEGLPVGSFKIYDNTGKVIATESYENGVSTGKESFESKDLKVEDVKK